MEKRYRTFKLATLATAGLIWVLPAKADPVSCNLSDYRAQAGIAAGREGDDLVLTWNGDRDQEVRLRLSIVDGRPILKEIALRRQGAQWQPVATGMSPDYSVMTGLRRMSNQQLEPLYGLGVKITQDVLNKYRWDPFWDAPFDLSVPQPNANGAFSGNPPPVVGLPGTDQPGLPRKPEEIARADAIYSITSCTVKTDGARLVVTYPGVKLGLFTGSL